MASKAAKEIADIEARLAELTAATDPGYRAQLEARLAELQAPPPPTEDK